MRFNTFDIFLMVYIAGVIMLGIKSYMSYIGLQKIKEETGVDLLQKRGVRFHMFSYPLFWPFYFVTEKNPLERFSEMFFKHYGDEGHMYLGTRGLKNFLNEKFLGKKRYQHCKLTHLTWELDKNAKEYQDFKALLKSEVTYASIIYTLYKNKYLMQTILEDKAPSSKVRSVSRFDLDGFHRLSLPQFKEQLLNINPQNAKSLFKELNISDASTPMIDKKPS